ncbi:MAG: hypothetical protein BECKG1743D_GA0114223_102213 [Candidatus Kentron sp. G]|nr:MAG: hypothetical protein BECKG1743D_GA0114223_102213 [Candidatus Kentron sp. G]
MLGTGRRSHPVNGVSPWGGAGGGAFGLMFVAKASDLDAL